MRRTRAARPAATRPTPTVPTMAEGIDRNRIYTREEICKRFGYDAAMAPVADRKKTTNNGHRFFREHFLRRGLYAVPIGKTYMVTGEAIFVWIAANAHRINDASE